MTRVRRRLSPARSIRCAVHRGRRLSQPAWSRPRAVPKARQGRMDRGPRQFGARRPDRRGQELAGVGARPQGLPRCANAPPVFCRAAMRPRGRAEAPAIRDGRGLPLHRRRRFRRRPWPCREGPGHGAGREVRCLSKIVSPNCNSADHGYWRAGSAFRPWRAFARDDDRACCRGWI